MSCYRSTCKCLYFNDVLEKYNGLKPPEGELKIKSIEYPIKNIYIELLRYAIPIVFVGIAIPLYTLVDRYTVADVLRAMGEPLETANAVFAYITNYAQKLIMIPASLATGFSLTHHSGYNEILYKWEIRRITRTNFKDISSLVILLTHPGCLWSC